MKLVKQTSGKTTVKMSRREWEDMGKKAGWTKNKTPSICLIKKANNEMNVESMRQVISIVNRFLKDGEEVIRLTKSLGRPQPSFFDLMFYSLKDLTELMPTIAEDETQYSQYIGQLKEAVASMQAKLALGDIEEARRTFGHIKESFTRNLIQPLSKMINQNTDSSNLM